MEKRRHYGVPLLLSATLLVTGVAQADSLESEFQSICSHTDSAAELPAAKLKSLVEESDRLLEALAASALPQKKVLTFRLKKCRNLFRYLLDVREPETGENHESSGSE